MTLAIATGAVLGFACAASILLLGLASAALATAADRKKADR